MSDAREILELRIHGVSGTPPEGMLDARFVSLRAGDATTGFYAPDPDEPVPGAAGTDRSRRLEGYSWRGMTSGSPLQALWVLLAPFALANTAAAMRPPVADDSRLRFVTRLHSALLRLFGLSLTLTLVMAVFVASIDEVAWQCGNNPACVSARTSTKFLGWSALSSPPRRMAVMLVVPLATIFGLWFLARRAWKARAAVLAVTGVRDLAHVAVVDKQTALDDPARWEDREPSEFLRHVHVAGALSAVSAMTAIGLAYWTTGSATALRFLGGVALVVLAAAVVAALVGWGEHLRSLRRVLSVGVLVTSGVVFVGLVVLLVTDPSVQTPVGVALPGVESIIVWLFLVQLFVMAVIGVLGVLPRAANREHRVGLGGAGSSVVSGFALVLGAMLSAGVVLRVGDFLGETTTKLAPEPAARVPMVIPNALTWAARGVVLLAVVFGVALVFGGVVWSIVHACRAVPRIGRGIAGFFAHAPAPDPAETERKERDAQVARATRFARLTDRAGVVLIGPAIVAFGVAVALTIVVALIDTHHYDPAFETRHGWIADHATVYGSWLITGFALGSVLVVLRARSNERLRRQVGILWDLTTFWPRHAQPLAPPCYTDRALPELVFRIMWHVKDQQHDVIISAHSQGSIIAAPVVLQLRASVRNHVALLTYGSPLQRLYARWFPAFFNTATFDELGKRISGRWQNLYRTTDPIGGHIPPDPPPKNVEIDPTDDIPSGDFVYPKIRVHSDYPAEPAFGAAVGALDAALVTAAS